MDDVIAHNIKMEIIELERMMMEEIVILCAHTFFMLQFPRVELGEGGER